MIIAIGIIHKYIIALGFNDYVNLGHLNQYP